MDHLRKYQDRSEATRELEDRSGPNRRVWGLYVQFTLFLWYHTPSHQKEKNCGDGTEEGEWNNRAKRQRTLPYLTRSDWTARRHLRPIRCRERTKNGRIPRAPSSKFSGDVHTGLVWLRAPPDQTKPTQTKTKPEFFLLFFFELEPSP